MIHKVEKLKSIGKFKDYQCSGDVAFKKMTLIYADNGTGKTTLTAIVRSLTEGRPEIVVKRKTAGRQERQEAKIVQRDSAGTDTHHNFRENGWSNPFPNVEIFDIHFVNENIYSGFEFNDEHKKKLHEFVIGAQGVAIKQQIEENKSNKTASRRLQGEIEGQIVQQVGFNLTANDINDFLRISRGELNNIDQKITAANAALETARANTVIQTLQLLTPLNPIRIGVDFDALTRDIRSSVQTIQDDALQGLFRTHCADLSDNSMQNAEDWLRDGHNYVISKIQSEERPITCPFCRNQIDDTLEIIKAYTLHFNEELNSLIGRLGTHNAGMSAFNYDATSQALGNTNEQNVARIALWASHLGDNVIPPEWTLQGELDRLRVNYDAASQSIRSKLQAPSVALEIDAISVLLATIREINLKVESYNQRVENYNTAINTLRAGVISVEQAQGEVNRLNRIKKRFEAPIDVLCTQLSSERVRLRSLESEYSRLVEQQETTARTFFNTYKDRINFYLGDVFKTPFRIDELVHVPPRGRATQSKIGYKFTIDGHEISFDQSQVMCIKDCLSEGDKSTIALAFFLSKIDIDPNKSEKVVVIDDPLSSFDSNRRQNTIRIIKNLLPETKQVVVLSHNEHFLHELTKGIPGGDRKALRISENFTNNEAYIEHLDLDSLVEKEYFRHIKELEGFLATPDITKKEDILGWMRNVLESHIKFKFYRQTSGLPETQRTFGKLIDKLEGSGVTFRDETNHSPIIEKLKIINAISAKPHHGEPDPDFGTLGINPASITVRELADFVKDTLDLINEKL